MGGFSCLGWANCKTAWCIRRGTVQKFIDMANRRPGTPGSQPLVMTNSDSPEDSKTPNGHPCKTGSGARCRPACMLSAAKEMHDLGLAVMPCGGPLNKKPLLRWRDGKLPSWNSIKTILCNPENADAGIGMLTGVGDFPITVVDIDNPTIVQAVMEAMGHTPIVVRTPSGGVHLWFRFDNERMKHLQGRGLPVDVLSKGGFVVTPPTARGAATGKQAGAYVFERGSLADLEQLSILPQDWETRLLALAPGEVLEGEAKSARAKSASGPIASRFREGERNTGLFRAALRMAPNCDSAADLARCLLDVNRLCAPSLPTAEVTKIAKSAWSLENRGENWARGAGVTQISTRETERLGSAYPCWLLLHLRQAHGSREEPFAVVARAMASCGVVPGMGEYQIKKALKHLLAVGLVKQVSKGGRCRGDASRYLLAPRD